MRFNSKGHLLLLRLFVVLCAICAFAVKFELQRRQERKAPLKINGYKEHFHTVVSLSVTAHLPKHSFSITLYDI